MRSFIADLHIHSRFSRATSPRLTVPHLAAWSAIKGIDVLATGDLTHPVWRQELREALDFDEESGLYRMRGTFDIATEASGYALPPGADPRGPLFMLEAEISSIYKRGGATRKVHNLVYLPDFGSADRLCAKLERIGNLGSDGRPILGLDSERLLAIVLDTDPRAVLIPAHIWTPWFSLFGSKSGFDSIRECFGDLSDRIFAIETGLSSDPDMNRLWSELDHIVMVSNSDAHSGENLGREGTVFIGAPSYDGIFAALRRAALCGAGEAARIVAAGEPPDDGTCLYAGTLEFFPEEGKYHLDGHRKCGVMLEPVETRKLGGICPVCGKPVTVGVLNRVMELADRTEPDPPRGTGFESLIPLAEIVSECLGVGPKSAKARIKTAEAVARLGSEFDILRKVPVETLSAYWAPLGSAIGRMREGRVVRLGGYDGEYGEVRVFPKEGRPAGDGSLPLSAGGAAVLAEPARKGPVWADMMGLAKPVERHVPEERRFTWSASQAEALKAGPYPVMVIAGPGSGKTRTLVGRILWLLGTGRRRPRDIVAVTFTRRAAGELKERIVKEAPGAMPEIDTIHALALRELGDTPPVVLSEEAARTLFGAVSGMSGKDAGKAFDVISLRRETLERIPEELVQAFGAYTRAKADRGLADYTDLLERWLGRLEDGTSLRRWQEVLVDEIQDLSPLQIRLLRALCGATGNGFFGIGDPDQSIYAFRGARPDIAEHLKGLWPTLRILSLSENYRSGADVLKSAIAVLGGSARCGALTAVRPLGATLRLFEAPNEVMEAGRIAKTCGMLIGSTSHSLQDSREAGSPLDGLCAPGDIAILVRTKVMIGPIVKALEARGIPYAAPEAEAFWKEPRVALMLGLAARRCGRAVIGGAELPEVPDDEAFKAPRTLADALSGTPPFDDILPRTPVFRTLERRFRECGGWEALLDWLALQRELDEVRDVGEVVRVMTVHAAKGLEFRVVFLPGLEEGLFPFLASDRTDGDAVDDERRLLYVGITRASEAVFISHCLERTMHGVKRPRQASRFLSSLPGLFTSTRIVRRVRTEERQLTFL